MPRVKLLHTHVIGTPGTEVVAFGHKFIIQPNGDAVCDMHPDFLPTELAAGRIALLEGNMSSVSRELKESKKLVKFGNNPGDFYGCGDIEAFRKALMTVQGKTLLQEFAMIKLDVKLPDSMTKADIIEEICTLVLNRVTGPIVED